MRVALIAVQLEIGAQTLASPETYRAHVENAVGRAVGEAGAADARVVVVPELAGVLALYALAPARAQKAKTLNAALAAAAVRRPLEMLRGVATTRTLAPRHAVLAALAPDGERFWRQLFGPLARRHDAWIAAGSHFRLGVDGDLTNASLLFAPDGRCVATTDKVNLLPATEDAAPSGLGLMRGDVDKLPIVDTPFGKLATLIGYDGFRVAHTPGERFIAVAARIAARARGRAASGPRSSSADAKRARGDGADEVSGSHGASFAIAVVANPSANPWRWREPVAPGAGTREDQWRREGLPASLAETRVARFGVTAYLVGGVLDLAYDGVSEIVDGEGVPVARAEHCDRGDHVAATVTW